MQDRKKIVITLHFFIDLLSQKSHHKISKENNNEKNIL